jgi:hypothetical protein
MKRDCSQMVSPGGGATPPTITSPTSPAAWQLTTWMTFELFMERPLLLILRNRARLGAHQKGTKKMQP